MWIDEHKDGSDGFCRLDPRVLLPTAPLPAHATLSQHAAPDPAWGLAPSADVPTGGLGAGCPLAGAAAAHAWRRPASGPDLGILALRQPGRLCAGIGDAGAGGGEQVPRLGAQVKCWTLAFFRAISGYWILDIISPVRIQFARVQ